MESRSVNPLTTISQYRIVYGCDLCGVAWVSPIVETTLENVFEMNQAVFCPRCTACRHHEDPSLRVPPDVLKVQDLDNEFSLIAQF